MRSHAPGFPFLAAIAAVATLAPAVAGDWLENTIVPVTNPVFFESPLIQSEVRPVVMLQRADPGFLGVRTDIRLYAVQLRYAFTERLAFIATKDGYVEMDPAGPLHRDGWADLAAGLKYELFRHDDRQFVVTPGFTFEFPTGNSEVLQGNGKGEANVFVSAMKGWDQLHLTALVGGRIPVEFSKETASVRYSAQLDYWVCRWFIPFVSFNAFTVVSSADAISANSEGFDLINFGSTDASGRTQGAVGGGFRSRLLPNLDLGVGYEYGVFASNSILKDRWTFDVAWRF
ncbi:MAG: hypothetical protein WCR07_16835 [Verrucomicrobiota bacterium]|jgi:hypothetical protein